MTDKKPGLIRRFFGAIWATLNFTRRLVINLIFLLFVLIFAAAIFGSFTKLEPRTALVFNPHGMIVEQYTADPGQRAFANLFGDKIDEVQLRDILHALDAAAKDTRIERLVIIPDDIIGAGVSTMREIGQAIDRFKASGKEVIAISNGMTQGQYYLAAHANQILLHPEGGILLDGFAMYRSYYKDALDQLGVDVHLFRVGEYKSAGEPYILNHASPEAREADLYWLNDLWGDFLGDISAQRNLDPQELSKNIDNMVKVVKYNGGNLSNIALQQHLVDQLMTRDEARALLTNKGVKDDRENTFRQISLKDYVALQERETLPQPSESKIAVVVAEGEILGGEQPPGMVGGESTAKLLREAREDEQIKAIVLRVNSPGGETFASEQIRREIELTKLAQKPVLVSMGDVAASGGYWISMNADEIWAEPTTITGSIGIFGLFMSIPNTLAKIGVHTDGVSTTALAGALDPRRPLDPKISELIQTIINKGYQDFITRVADARHKTPEEINTIARGRVWSGKQAKERGLVDQLGSLDEVITAAATRANLGTNYHVHYVEKEPSTWERLALSFSSQAQSHIGQTLNLNLPHSWFISSEMQRQIPLLRRLRNNQIGVFAYCFCEIK